MKKLLSLMHLQAVLYQVDLVWLDVEVLESIDAVVVQQCFVPPQVHHLVEIADVVDYSTFVMQCQTNSE